VKGSKFPPGASLLGILAIVGALLLAGFISVLPTFRTVQTVGSTTGTQGTTGGGPGTGGAAGANPSAAAAVGGVGSGRGGGGAAGGGTSGGGAAKAAGSGPATGCDAGHNGGATDTGITATSISLASTVAESGIGESFLGEVRYGMTAVTNQVNTTGGICGRQLSLNLVDDGWNRDRGAQYIRTFIADGVFALPVVPSSEGLNQSSNAHDIDRAGIPVIGTDGMLKSQYSDPWIWPVATSTVSTAHIAASHAYHQGARSFGIVYDSDYKFGPEGNAAFSDAISHLPGATLKVSVGVTAGQSDYSSDGSTFNNKCSPCDMVFILMDPTTAESWFATSGANGARMFTEGPQPLFVYTFGQNCGAPCNNMVVWTSYYPPRPPFTSRKAVADYVNAIKGVSDSADVDNQFLEGGYDGMLLFVDALRKVGPELTRARLRDTLNTMTFDSGLSQALHWSASNHAANTAMLGFTDQYSGGFNDFQYAQTGWVSDPWPTMDR